MVSCLHVLTHKLRQIAKRKSQKRPGWCQSRVYMFGMVNPDWWPLGKAGKIQDVSLALAYFDGSSGWHVLILTRFNETRSQSGISGLAIQTYLLLDSIICWHSSQRADFPCLKIYHVFWKLCLVHASTTSSISTFYNLETASTRSTI